MKRKRILLLSALAGACFHSGSLLAQTSGSRLVQPASSVGHIGDGVQAIGDKSRLKPALTADARPSEFRTNNVDTQLDSTPLGSDAPMHRASWSQEVQPAPAQVSYPMVDAYEMGTTYQSSSSPMNGFWAEFDSLLWFSGERHTPALVTRNQNPGVVPSLGQIGTTVVAGDTATVGSGLQPGYRANLGIWLDDTQDLGIIGGAFGLFGRQQNKTFDRIGSESLGVPFYNSSFGLPSAYTVNFDSGANGADTGRIVLASRLNLIGADASIRKAVIKSGSNRLDFTAGYLFARLDDKLSLRTTYTDGQINLIPDGTVFNTADNFRGQNTFHGGQLGLLSQFHTGAWAITSGAKFGLGNMQESVTVSAPPNQNLLVQASNVGTQTRNVFAFIPQIDLKLGYKLRQDLQFNVGYSMMYFSDVALAGNQIDTNIDVANLLGAPTAPAQKFVNDSLLLHGVSLGVNWSF